MYEKTFVTLTERFFKGVPWPPVELLAVLVDHDHVFCMLYKVLCQALMNLARWLWRRVSNGRVYTRLCNQTE